GTSEFVRESLWHQAMSFMFVSKGKADMPRNRIAPLTQYTSAHNWFHLCNISLVGGQIRLFHLFLPSVVSSETVQSMSFQMRCIWKVLFGPWTNSGGKRLLSK